MNNRLTVGQVIKKAGGMASLVRLLGYPINRYTVERWRRKREFPAEFRGKIAAYIGVKAEQLDPDTEGRIIRIRFRQMAEMYKSMVASSGANTRTLHRLHSVRKERVQRWRWGLEEVPLSAFEDLYRMVQARTQKMTVEMAKEITGLTQTEIAARLGLSAGMGTYWRKLGAIPPEYAERIRAWRSAGE